MIPYRLRYSPFALLLAACFILSRPGVAGPPDPDPADLMRSMLAAVGRVSTSTYRLIKTERISGKPLTEETTVKLNTKPQKVYIRHIKPYEGREVLYVTGSNGGKALINPNSFPYVNVSLDPLGARVRQNQHHTLLDVGFGTVASIIAHDLEEHRDELPKILHLDPAGGTFDGRPCWLVKMEVPQFRWVSYTVKPGGESLEQIGHKLNVSEHMIGEKLNGFGGDYQENLAAGRVIQVPTTYARRLVVLIDKQTQLPVSISIYDDQGLYEQYEYHDLRVNLGFRADEFTPEFKGYHF